MPNKPSTRSLVKSEQNWKPQECKFYQENHNCIEFEFGIFFVFRDIREYKSRVESYSREMLRKEAQVRDLQQRLENGEGSKYTLKLLMVD